MRRNANITRPVHPADEAAPLGKGNDHAKPVDALAVEMGLPPGTMSALDAHGKGPPTFKVGRRKFCRVSDFYEWIDKIATGEIDATLVEKRRHLAPEQVPQPQRQPQPRPQPQQRRAVAERRQKRGEDRTSPS
jgi:hypothetical protein